MAPNSASSSSSSPIPIVFSTRHSEPELVVPSRPTPHETKNLSDIDDQESLRFQIPFIMFYGNNNNDDDDDDDVVPLLMAGGKKKTLLLDPVVMIKRALSEALVLYYPLAGRLREGPNRKLTMDCNGKGIMFVGADASVSLARLGRTILPPSPHIKQFLKEVPGSDGILGCPLLLVQVTRLTCGGFVLAIRMNHAICDSIGLVQFLTTVSQFATSSPISQFPVWQRQILSARNPPRVTCIHHEYNEPTSSHPNDYHDSPQTLHHQSFIFTPKHVLSLRNRLPIRLRDSSAFELLTACLWRCRTRALALRPDDVVSLSTIINARGRSSVELPDGYYGNSFAFPTAVTDARSLCEKPLGYAVELVRKLKGEMSEECVRSVADLMAVKGRRPMVRRRGNFLVADISRVGLERVEFGWGKAEYGGAVGAVPYLNLSIYSKFKKGIVVPIMLPVLAMNRFISELVEITSEDKTVEKHSYEGIMSML